MKFTLKSAADAKIRSLQNQIAKMELEASDATTRIAQLTADRNLLLEIIENAATQSDTASAAIDNVNSPRHYTIGGIETIDFIQAKLTDTEFAGYCKGNALKYVSRANLKGGMESMKKAQWYLNRLIKNG